MVNVWCVLPVLLSALDIDMELRFHRLHGKKEVGAEGEEASDDVATSSCKLWLAL